MADTERPETSWPDIIRVSGEMTCDDCGKPYRKHPQDKEHLGYDDHPYLRVRCDGQLLKL